MLTNDHILNGRWMAEQNKRSQRLEREVLGDDPKAVMRHNLNHYRKPSPPSRRRARCDRIMKRRQQERHNDGLHCSWNDSLNALTRYLLDHGYAA